MNIKLLSVQEVAKILSVSEARVYEMARQRIIPAVRLGRQVRVAEDALEAWIKNGGQSLPGGWRRDPNDPMAG